MNNKLVRNQHLDLLAIRNSIPGWHESPENSGPTPVLNDLLAIFGADFHRTRDNVRYLCNTFTSSGYQLVSHQWVVANSRGTVVIVHGYLDHIPLYRRVIDCLLDQGFSVVGFDLPGHGLSAGRRASINNFDHYQQILLHFIAMLSRADHLKRPFHLVGQSTGGGISMHYLLTQQPSFFEKSVLLAPLVRPLGWRSVFLLHSLLAPFLKQITRTFHPNSHDEEFLTLLRTQDPFQCEYIDVAWLGAMKRWARQLEAMPPSTATPLIIQGTHDYTVDWRHNLKVIARKFPRSEILRIDDGMHQLANESTEYLLPILAAMREHFA